MNSNAIIVLACLAFVAVLLGASYQSSRDRSARPWDAPAARCAYDG
jgi:hypothetical protein